MRYNYRRNKNLCEHHCAALSSNYSTDYQSNLKQSTSLRVEMRCHTKFSARPTKPNPNKTSNCNYYFAKRTF